MIQSDFFLANRVVEERRDEEEEIQGEGREYIQGKEHALRWQERIIDSYLLHSMRY